MAMHGTLASERSKMNLHFCREKQLRRGASALVVSAVELRIDRSEALLAKRRVDQRLLIQRELVEPIIAALRCAWLPNRFAPGSASHARSALDTRRGSFGGGCPLGPRTAAAATRATRARTWAPA